MTPLDRLADAANNYELCSHDVLFALIAVARAARGTCGARDVELINALTALDTAIVKALGDKT